MVFKAAFSYARPFCAQSVEIRQKDLTLRFVVSSDGVRIFRFRAV